MDFSKQIKNKNAVINIKTKEDDCFGHAIMSALQPRMNHTDRSYYYPNYKDELNFDGIEFSVSTTDIEGFEKKNNVITNSYIIENKKSALYFNR